MLEKDQLLLKTERDLAHHSKTNFHHDALALLHRDAHHPHKLHKDADFLHHLGISNKELRHLGFPAARIIDQRRDHHHDQEHDRHSDHVLARKHPNDHQQRYQHDEEPKQQQRESKTLTQQDKRQSRDSQRDGRQHDVPPHDHNQKHQAERGKSAAPSPRFDAHERQSSPSTAVRNNPDGSTYCTTTDKSGKVLDLQTWTKDGSYTQAGVTADGGFYSAFRNSEGIEQHFGKHSDGSAYSFAFNKYGLRDSQEWDKRGNRTQFGGNEHEQYGLTIDANGTVREHKALKENRDLVITKFATDGRSSTETIRQDGVVKDLQIWQKDGAHKQAGRDRNGKPYTQTYDANGKLTDLQTWEANGVHTQSGIGVDGKPYTQTFDHSGKLIDLSTWNQAGSNTHSGSTADGGSYTQTTDATGRVIDFHSWDKNGNLWIPTLYRKSRPVIRK